MNSVGCQNNMLADSGFVVLQGTTYWTDLFVRHFLFQEEQAIDCDDLLFFVRKRHVKGSSRYLPKYEVRLPSIIYTKTYLPLPTCRCSRFKIYNLYLDNIKYFNSMIVSLKVVLICSNVR